jgi:hypothetical protein
MAKYAGVSMQQVREVWMAADLKPHRLKSFKISKDPEFAERVPDVVGLYLDPPHNAMVLSVDEKTQIQVLNRTQALVAAQAAPDRTSDPRLKAKWDPKPLCGLRRRYGRGYGQSHQAPPGARELNDMRRPSFQRAKSDRVERFETPFLELDSGAVGLSFSVPIHPGDR